VALFLSTITNKVDKKGRVSVPAAFRANLSGPGAPPNGALVLFRSFQYSALEGCTVERMQELSARLDTLEQFSPEHDALSTLFSDAQQLTLDSEGRIGLPEDLLAFANISETVSFVGAGSTFQLWEPAAYAAHKEAMRERMRKHNTTLPGSPARGAPALVAVTP
jgi:MraZ protein